LNPTPNGMSAADLPDARWYKSRLSSPQGNCVEVATLPGEQIAMRDSRHPDGPALILITDLVHAVEHGELDHLVIRPHGRRETRSPGV
jgi:Domain of unknown function (DUF397)